jgi:mannose-1-phosphate guanylyltransferase
VLAGGEGVRLRPLVRQVCGDERPKQFVPLLGPRSLLGQTVNRVARLVPGERTVVVSVGSQRRYLAAEVLGMDPLHVLVQPHGRGTAAAILLAAHWIRARDPHAIVAVCPSDHFVLEEAPFMEHVGQVAETVRRCPRQIILVGARPASPEVEYGWIEPGEVIARAGQSDIRRVAAFREKPSAEEARDMLARGCLWNTFVFVAGLDGLLSLADSVLPAMNERLQRIASFWGTEHEAFGLRQGYALMPSASFSRAMLEARPDALAVSELPPLTWSDLGTPRRVLAVIRDVKLAPPWHCPDFGDER